MECRLKNGGLFGTAGGICRLWNDSSIYKVNFHLKVMVIWNEDLDRARERIRLDNIYKIVNRAKAGD